jgi:beta-lactamase class A
MYVANRKGVVLMKRHIGIVLFVLLTLCACGSVDVENSSDSILSESSVENTLNGNETSSNHTEDESSKDETTFEESEETNLSEDSEISLESSCEESSLAAESVEECTSEDVSSEEESSEEEPYIPLPENMETNIETKTARVILAQIEKIASRYKNVSIYYCDTATGYFYSTNTDEKYASASVIKPFYCQYLLSINVDLNKKIQLTKVTKTSASGKLTKDAIGKWFTVKDLMSYAICRSDNMAYYLLYETFGKKGFNDYIRTLGLSEPKLSTNEYTTLDAESAALCMREIYRYAEETGDQFLVDLLKSTTHNAQIAAGTEAEVAHKYGFQDGKNLGYHDVAIVYTAEPYILAICTQEDPYAENSSEVFVKIASIAELLHTYLHQ